MGFFKIIYFLVFVVMVCAFYVFFFVVFCQVLYENGVNGILADEMGLGKTIQCISVIAHMIEMGVKGPFLIAAPLSTVPNWVSEFKRFTPTVS